MAEDSTTPHRDAKLAAASQPTQLSLLEVTADDGEKCEHCGRRHPSVSYHHAARAAWCHACAIAGGLTSR
ncbi:hypothetical protein [Hyalangium sp.]|uniref:hypothetical protein n=1 Tax=Hyalangium sp. TaxID=2028555 RepID=UPI002D666C67|nr:hypothetical protein [Hyalangium sp.]HYI00563.1 hypothetical protein [Hyalangium sp.]